MLNRTSSTSPWWGGFYEGLVGSAKMSLKKSLGKVLVTKN